MRAEEPIFVISEPLVCEGIENKRNKRPKGMQLGVCFGLVSKLLPKLSLYHRKVLHFCFASS